VYAQIKVGKVQKFLYSKVKRSSSFGMLELLIVLWNL